MLSRPQQLVRANLRGLTPEQAFPYLEAIGWPGDIRLAAEYVATAIDRADAATVALNLGATAVYPGLGVECFLREQPPLEPRWDELLGELVADGLCSELKRAALLGAAGETAPPDSERPWPAAWIAEALRAGPEHFGLLARQVTHIKLALRPDGSREAKGYFGLGLRWRNFMRRAADSRVDPVRAHRSTVRSAIARALAFLLGRRTQAGWWHEFRLPRGTSDEWVSAYIAAHLACLPDQAAQAAASQVWRRLCARRSDEDGWGYSRTTPPDADSTGWALRLADALGESDSPMAARGRSFLCRHLVLGGGITTYGELGPIRSFTRLSGTASFAGWNSAHACVTAAAATIVGAPALDFLRRSQALDGAWQGYWWPDNEYTTALAVEALAAQSDPADQGRLRDAAAWAARRVDSTGAVTATGFGPSPFATAWCVRILAVAGGEEAPREAALAWLLASQEDDGSWQGSARLRVPMPDARNPDAAGRRYDVLDEGRAFTTATVIAALQLAAGEESFNED
jgi:hypothetical protein